MNDMVSKMVPVFKSYGVKKASLFPVFRTFLKDKPLSLKVCLNN